MTQTIISNELLLDWGSIHRKVEKGRVIFCEGEKACFYYQIVAGQVRMINTGNSGKEFIQGLFGPGESFGEPALITDQPYPAGAVAVTDTVLLRMPRDTFLKLLRNNPDIHFGLTYRLAARLRQKSILSKEMCISEPTALIHRIMRQYTTADSASDDGRLRVTLTRQQIADMTGLRVETVIRIIRMMFKKGELKVEKGKVYV